MLIVIQLVSGTGPDGRVRAQDVESYVPAPAAPAPVAAPVPGAPAPVAPAPVPGAVYTDIPLSNVRKV